MKSKKKKSKYARKGFQKIKEFEYPEFTLRIEIITYDDLKKWNLINSDDFKEYLKKHITNDYEGNANG